jgi:rhodanese-related sulfurtransferase
MRYLYFLVFYFVFKISALAQVQSAEFDKLIKKTIKGSVKTISVQELAKNYAKYIVFDTRESKEYKVSHLKNAKNLGFTTIDHSLLKNVPKNAPIVVYCSIGARSEIVGEKLKAKGYTNVQNLYGSIFEWVNSGYPVYTSKNIPTQKVHTYDSTWGLWLEKGKRVW